MKKILAFYHQHRTAIFVGLIAAIISIIALGCVLLPTLFYDQWIWKYYWGPVVADATPGTQTAIHNGVVAQEGYTLISEISYGVLLIGALYGIYQLFKKLDIQINWQFALALLPYIIFGPVGRTLEDTGYFTAPVVYWFISPLIYLQIAVYALFFVLLGYYFERKKHVHHLTINKTVFLGGFIFLIPSFWLIAQWILGDQWNISTGVRFDVFLIVIGITSAIIAVVYSISQKVSDSEKLKPYGNPLNLAMLFGHLIDGLASYISIKDPFNMGLSYAEKHPASELLLNIWGPLFPIVKFLLIIVIIYVFDILYKKELQGNQRLVNLLKIGILILGFSPGLRDLLRVTMGV